MNSQSKHEYSQLFVVRLWTEKMDGDQIEYRGRVQHVPSGDIRHFRDWAALTEFLIAQMEEANHS